MKAFILSDKEYQTETFEQVHRLVYAYLTEKGCEITETQIGRDDLAFCMGCFGCWVKKPGECVIGDAMAEINRTYMNSDVVVYLCPVVFGQFSANLKNAVDRWLPNILPFFESRPDGSTIHPPRYEDYPRLIMIGYGDDLSEEDARLFTDITLKHRRNVAVFVYQNAGAELVRALDAVDLQRVGGQL